MQALKEQLVQQCCLQAKAPAISCTDGTGKASLSYLTLYAKVIQWSTDLQLPCCISWTLVQCI